MEISEINDFKKAFKDTFESLSFERQSAIKKWFDIYTIESLIRRTKSDAQGIIDYADKKGYGYGEIGYYLNEAVDDFAEDTPELKREYDNLLNAYFEFLTDNEI
jgi:hypothetical protein